MVNSFIWSRRRNHSAAHRSGAALRQERRMLEERRVLPLVLLPNTSASPHLCATGCPRAGANGALPMSGSKKARALRPPNGGASPDNSAASHGKECTNEFSQQSLRHFPGHRAGFGFPRRLRRELLHATLFRSHGHAALRSAVANSTRNLRSAAKSSSSRWRTSPTPMLPCAWLSIWRAQRRRFALCPRRQRRRQEHGLNFVEFVNTTAP